MIIDKINEAMKLNNNILSLQQLVSIGVSKTTLTNYVNSGYLVRCSPGFYALPNVIEDDMFLISQRSKNIVFSHETALFLNGLSERTPFKHSFTIPSNASIPRTLKNQCKCYYVKPELFGIGITEKKTTFGNTVRCYDSERTLCDVLRRRNRMDEETVIAAIKLYGISKEKNLNNLAKYAELFKVSQEITHYMEVLL